MEAVFAPYEQQRVISSKNNNMHMKKPTRKNTRSSISRTSTENIAPLLNNYNDMYGPGGIFYGPPRVLSYSYPPPTSFNPPLLPLPISKPYRTQSFSHPQVKKTNRPSLTKDQSLTPRKSKQPNRKEEPKKASLVVLAPTSPTVPLGPDPNDLPKHVPSTFSGNLDKFSGSVFTLSPPPSSLPLPKFSMRPKLSCNAEAAGNIDAGATDNLRRMLRLR